MNSHYYTEIAFPAAHNEALDQLLKLKRYVDKKRLEPNPNTGWLDFLEMIIVKQMSFIDVSKQTFKSLFDESKAEKKISFEQGRSQARSEYEKRERYGNLNFDTKEDKERIRALSIFHAQNDFNI